MSRVILLLLTLGLAGCPATPGPVTPPAASVGAAVVDTSKLTIKRVAPHAVEISGAPGAITPGLATTVTLTAGREDPSAWRVLHLSEGHLAVDSTFASLAADGSFAAVTLGQAERGVTPGQVLGITPQVGIKQAGLTAFMPIF